MTTLADTRPHVFIETPIDARHWPQTEPHTAGLLLEDLLKTYPDVDLPTVRLWRHSADGVPTLRIDARRGQLTPECRSCHTTPGRPHTDFCTIAPGETWAERCATPQADQP